MIIGDSLAKLFDGLEVTTTNNAGETTTRAVKFHYGDQKELLKWIELKGNESIDKYPLIWYVISDYKERNQWKIADNGLIILSDTKPNYMNDERYTNTYSYIIDPVWKLVEKKLRKSNSFEFIGASSDIEDRYIIKDEPNYGVDADSNIRLSQNDFRSSSKKGTESITPDIVDARAVEFKFRINTMCV